ncbi:MAG: hypothetical protein CMI54_03810 [Parcubacteria group bacterium]|nr:hypothetical protein [Parcubacteria group bacterium]|tara:strand:+ start:9266 stop:9496 length:231 start_codon:yes stop_codon:yes gene_type:complete
MATKGTFYEATVEFEINNNGGKAKKVKEYYLVLADSVTYAEVQVATLLEAEGASPWTVISAKKSKLTNVVTELIDK